MALTFTVGHVAYLATCHAGRCRPTARVGSSSLKPQSAVAVQPFTGRALVRWHARTSKGVNRLRWRITTNGKLGRTHTLGEFGDSPQLATDASGKTVAVWLADRRARRQGVRTAARRVSEFLSPTSVTSSPAGNLRVTSGDGGATVAAWLTAPGAIDPENLAGNGPGRDAHSVDLLRRTAVAGHRVDAVAFRLARRPSRSSAASWAPSRHAAWSTGCVRGSERPHLGGESPTSTPRPAGVPATIGRTSSAAAPLSSSIVCRPRSWSCGNLASYVVDEHVQRSAIGARRRGERGPGAR